MKKFLIAVFIIASQLILAQNSTIKTSFFSFNCNCKEIENTYNNKNKSYNYTYLNNDDETGYMISVKNEFSKELQSSFLKLIKNSGTFDYIDTKFLGNKAIIASININGKKAKHLAFFTDNKAYTIMIIGNSQSSVNQLYVDLKNTFKTF